jgi:ABC-type transport system substrate-binding protein
MLGILILAWLWLPLQLMAAEPPKTGGKLVFGLEKDITSLNPFVRTQSTDEMVRNLFYEALLDTDPNGNIIPSLAESWNVSKDGLDYTFKLRSGVKFHNGQEMTAEDVKWSAEYSMNPKNGATGLNYLKHVKSVAALDRYTVRFTLKAPIAPFLAYLASIKAFSVAPKESVPQGVETVPSFPPGTGPFQFKEYKPGREVVFTRFKDYRQKGLPYLDEVVLRPVEEPTVRFASLRAGDLDMIERTPYAFVRKVDAAEVRGIKATAASGAGFRRIIFNVLEPPFNNPNLRLAVAYAIDKKQYLQGAFWGYGTPTDQRVPMGNSWFVKMPQRERDAAKVKALLKEAGVVGDFEPELLGRKGAEEEHQVLERQLADAGIKVKVTVLEFGAYRQRQRSGDFQMILYGGDLPIDPHDTYPVDYGCLGLEEAKAKKRTLNVSGYCNKEAEKIMEEAGKITDQKRRYEIYAKALPLIFGDAPEVPLAFVPRFYTYHDKVKGFVTDADGRINATTFGISRVWVDK